MAAGHPTVDACHNPDVPCQLGPQRMAGLRIPFEGCCGPLHKMHARRGAALGGADLTKLRRRIEPVLQVRGVLPGQVPVVSGSDPGDRPKRAVEVGVVGKPHLSGDRLNGQVGPVCQ